MKLNLSSQIVLNKVPVEFYRPRTAVERSEITRCEKITTDIFPSIDEGAKEIADCIQLEITSKQREGRYCVLALGTGLSLTPVYSELIRKHREEKLSFKNVVVFNAYEYFPLNPESKNSSLNQLKERFLNHVDIDSQNVFSPDGTISQDAVQEYCRLYEQRIATFGGLDVCLLGIGRIGNIATNEPGSGIASTSRLMLIDATSRQEMTMSFGTQEPVPPCSITMGVQTILSARKIFLTAWGEEKADIIQKAVEGPLTDAIPASFLQTHNNVRVVIDSPHPDDDVISMGGTLRRLVQQGHDVHVAYETSGNIAVGDEEVTRFMHFINGFNQIFDENKDEVIKKKYKEIKKYLAEKKEGDIDSADIRTIKGLIRRGEARTACTYNQIPLDHVHFLDLPFYESGKIEKLPMTEADVNIVRELIAKVKPHQIYVAGDLADPHGTHRKCTDAVFAAIDLEKEAGAAWLKDCRIWMYRGAWAEWEIENIEMCVPMSPEELRAKRNSILKHQSQMESAPFLGNDERLFWQRSEDRNRGTAKLYDDLGLACYEAMEAFVEYKPL